jgi:hypothetical protein
MISFIFNTLTHLLNYLRINIEYEQLASWKSCHEYDLQYLYELNH